MKTYPSLSNLTLRIDLTFTWMNNSPPEMMGRAVTLAILAFPLVKLEIERHSLVGYVAAPDDVSLPDFHKRVLALRDELERDLEPEAYKAKMAARRAKWAGDAEEFHPPVVEPAAVQTLEGTLAVQPFHP